ncbi:MAG: anti-sigma factor, partial [Clostridium sp.]
MKCDEVKQYFIDYLEDNLADEEKLNINIHLEGCSECRAELLELKSLVNEINENKEEINVPVDFMDKIRERALKINNPEAKRKKRPLKVFFIAAVILTLSVGTVFADKFPFAELFKLMNPEPRIENIVDKGKGDRLNISKIDRNPPTGYISGNSGAWVNSGVALYIYASDSESGLGGSAY